MTDGRGERLEAESVINDEYGKRTCYQIPPEARTAGSRTGQRAHTPLRQPLLISAKGLASALTSSRLSSRHGRFKTQEIFFNLKVCFKLLTFSKLTMLFKGRGKEYTPTQPAILRSASTPKSR